MSLEINIKKSIEVEDLELCKKCGGECCKRAPCHYSPDDFKKISFKALKKEIEKGNISIDWWEGDIDDKKDRYGKVYYLRIKKIGGNIVDPSWGGVPCSIWNEKTGCPLPFKERPKGARALVPAYLIPDLGIPGKCNSTYTREMCVLEWRKHHTILKRLEAHFAK